MRLATIAAMGVLMLAAATIAPAQDAPAPAAAGRQSMDLPGLGGNSRLDCETLDVEGGTGRLHARGSVSVRSDDLNIDCDELIYDESGKTLDASGQRVQIQMGEVVAVGGTLHYNTETGSMQLGRGDATEQPYVVQQQEESTFTAWADTITIDQDASGEAITRFEGNVQVHTQSNQATPEATQTP